MRKFLILLVIAIATTARGDWTRGGLFGADVRSLVVDRNNPDLVFLGTSGGEVYVSHDGAGRWEPVRGSIPFPGFVVDNLLIDSHGRLWAGCWGLWGGGVIAVSADEGKTWERRDRGLDEVSVRSLAVDSSDPNVLLAGGLDGVYRSDDSGRAWTKVFDQINVESLAIDPRNPDRIYVGTWRQAWRSEDGGKNWSLINNGMVLDTDVFSITMNPANPDDMWLSTCGWVYNSTDAGTNWTRYRDGFNNRRIHDIELDPQNPKALYAGSVAGLYRSEDQGHTWKLASDEGLVVKRVGLHPARPDRIILGTEGDGVYVSNDGGKTFLRSSTGLHNLRVATILADPEHQGRVYASLVFGNTASGIYASDDSGAHWNRLSRTRLPEVLTMALNDDPDARFVAGTEKGFFWSKDGSDWVQAEPQSTPIRVDKVLRLNQTRFFAATADGVFTSRDGGRNWYLLAAQSDRAVDIALGTLGGARCLFALMTSGVQLFDGEKWATISDAPAKGRTIAVRGSGPSQLLFVAGAGGVRAGKIAPDRRWIEAPAPESGYAAVFGVDGKRDQMLVLTSRRQREILLGSSVPSSDWQAFVLPTENTEIATVSADPFDEDRYYLGTVGEGILVFHGKPQKFAVSGAAATGGYSAGGDSK
jgi:photosystem II stability/assembly factor-like uncharacterized protein